MKTDQNKDAKLVEAYKAGDKKALAILVKRWHKTFCDKAYWLVKDKDLAKDIAQDSWTIIIHKMDKLKNPNQFKYWALRIVCNKAMDCLRLQARKQTQTFSHEIEIENKDEVDSDNNNLKIALLKAIKQLPENQKTIIKLFYTEAYSLKQISEFLQISVGTAKSRLFHAREKLKLIVKNKNHEN